MMFAKTFCKPGSYVEVAPIGLQAMLQYNQNGLLQRVCLLEPDTLGIGFHKEVSKEALRKIYNIVPTSINLKDGTTYVEGTFFSKSLPLSSGGDIAHCANDELIKRLEAGEEFEFYAGNVRSLAASFKGALTIRNWLSSHGFRILPGIVVPVEMKQETLDMLFSRFTAPFNPKFIALFYIFEGTNEARLVTSDLYYNKVEKCQMSIDRDGFTKGVLALDNNDVITVNYSDACTYFCDAAPHVKILYSRTPEGIIDIVAGITESVLKPTTSYICPVCHKQVILPKTGPCQCSDPNCLSVLYFDACKMLSRLSLPEMTYEQYMEHVNNKDIICLTDILLLDNYKDAKIEITISEALASIVPISVISDFTFYEKLANSCNNSIDSVLYYLKNPKRIITELGINSPMVQRFINWISSPYNLTSVETVFAAVKLKARSKKFEGAPIFRNNAFVLTGKFKRGLYNEIASILESYEATVLTDIDILSTHKVPNALIVGGTNEDISGSLIRSARSHNIPIINEDEFFSKYGIDEDLVANLL